MREFEVRWTDEAIADLRERLTRTRWPEAETVDDWSQGIPRAYVQELLSRHNGNITHAAREAGQERRAFGKLAKKYRLTR